MKNEEEYKNIKVTRKYDEFGLESLTAKRIIVITGEIDDGKADMVIRKLINLDSINHKDITIYINSNGGSVSSGLAIYDAMNMIKSKILTICIGKCCSMASILLINGSKGKRFILPNAEVMIHEVSSISYGKVKNMEDDLEHTKWLNNQIYNIISKNTKLSLKELKKRTLKKDYWLTAEKALEFGFVDKILN